MTEETWIEFGRCGSYRISSLGRVQGRYEGFRDGQVLLGEWRDKILKMSKTDKNGGFYLTFKYGEKHVRLHTFMWEMFKGPRTKGKVINHIDGNRLNCAIDNLEEVTQKENIRNLRMRGNHREWGRPRTSCGTTP